MKAKLIKKYCAGCSCLWHEVEKTGAHYCSYGCVIVGDGVEISALPSCPRGKAYLKSILRRHREEQRARNRKKLTPRKRQLLRDLRVGLIAGIVAGIVCLIELVTLK